MFREGAARSAMATLEELRAIEDPRLLFLLATEAINERQEDVDEIAAIRAGAIAALYAQGYSYRAMADTLGVSAPRVGQLVAASDAAPIEVLRSWFAIEERLEEIARLAPEAQATQRRSSYSTAIRVLASSGRIDEEMLRELDSIRQLRNHLIHGRAEISDETADNVIDKAIRINAILTLWLGDERERLGTTSSPLTSSPHARRRSVTSIAQAEQKLAQLAKDEAALRKRVSDASSAAAKARATASTKRQQAAKTSSSAMIRSYLSSAETAEKKAASEDRKVADAAKKLGELAKRRADAVKQLDRANQSAERSRNSADNKRRTEEKRHAQEIARISRPTVRYVHEVRTVEPPKPEKLRVLYLTSNPDSNSYLRVDVEVREVRQAIRKATHRDLVEMDHRPAATPEDLLDGMNEQRPHVIHFAGHGGDYSILLDNASVEEPSGRAVSFDLLARALAATDSPPKALVLNACDTLEGADVLLESVPIVIAMASSISDLAASAFAARFYSAVASAQSVQAAVDQGAVAVELLDLSEGWKPSLLCREATDPASLILVQPFDDAEA